MPKKQTDHCIISLNTSVTCKQSSLANFTEIHRNSRAKYRKYYILVRGSGRSKFTTNTDHR